MSEEADYQLNVTVRAEGQEVRRVPCKVYLPAEKTGPVLLRFSPTRKQVTQLKSMFQCSIAGSVRDLAGTRTEIRATRVYLRKFSTRTWGPTQRETRVEASPTDLRVIQHFGRTIAELKGKTVGTFWLTKSSMLTPSKTFERSLTGDVSVQTVRYVKFNLRPNLELNFDTHYQFTSDSSDRVVSAPELVARFESSSSDPAMNQTMENVQGHLDNFLLIVSFGERQICGCVGWEAANERGIEKSFRRGITIPTPRKDYHFSDALVDVKDFEEFARLAYDQFVAIGSPLVRQALVYALCREDQTLEHDFLTLYAAIETILLHYRRVTHLETVLDPEAWRGFSRDLRAYLRNDPRLKDARVRGLVSDKISELNRVSFATAFRAFCSDYAVDLTDLWSVTRDPRGISLSEIRNRLVHGERFIATENVVVAMHHLRWIIERMLLAFLGWPVARSNVRSEFLAANAAGHQNWRDYQRTFPS